MSEFRAYRVPEEGGEDKGQVVQLDTADLPEGEVLIRGEWSSINYKDALAVTGAGKILRRFPMTPGIDVAGTVASSSSSAVREGDRVLVTGCGMGEVHDGGFAEYVRVPADWIVPVPESLGTRDAMALGTAGFTAALALIRMERNGQTPDSGDVVVTGASGGVGSIAVDLLSAAGYRVIAVSGKPEAADTLRELGAAEVVAPDDVKRSSRPLDKGLYGGIVDNVGGDLLAELIPHVADYGNVAAIGLAGGVKLQTTVMPYILRGVSLLGISSANCPRDLRLHAWERLGGEMKPRHLSSVVTNEVGLDGVKDACQGLIDRKVQGRTVVRLAD